MLIVGLEVVVEPVVALEILMPKLFAKLALDSGLLVVATRGAGIGAGLLIAVGIAAALAASTTTTSCVVPATVASSCRVDGDLMVRGDLLAHLVIQHEGVEVVQRDRFRLHHDRQRSHQRVVCVVEASEKVGHDVVVGDWILGGGELVSHPLDTSKVVGHGGILLLDHGELLAKLNNTCPRAGGKHRLQC